MNKEPYRGEIIIEHDDPDRDIKLIRYLWNTKKRWLATMHQDDKLSTEELAILVLCLHIKVELGGEHFKKFLKNERS